MKKSLVCLSVLSLLGLAVPGIAAAPKPAKAAAKAASKGVIDQIVSVSEKDKTVTISKGTKDVTYTVKESTKIVINNKAGTFEGLKSGMKAIVHRKEKTTEATSIYAQDIPKGKGGKHK